MVGKKSFKEVLKERHRENKERIRKVNDKERERKYKERN